MTGDVDADLEIRQLVVLSEGCMDAVVLVRWELRREKEHRSEKWLDRQNRKIDGAMRAFQDLVKKRKEEGGVYLVGKELSLADVAVVCAVGFVEFCGLREGWREKYVEMSEWWAELDEREGFKETRPVAFELTEQVV